METDAIATITQASTRAPAREAVADSRIGSALHAFRKAAGITGRMCAERAGVSMRTLVKIEQGDPSVSLGRYLAVASVLNAHWLFDLFAGSPDEPALQPPTQYLSGLSALCLPGRDNLPALWHTTSLHSPEKWQIAGRSLAPTTHLLGACGIHNVAHSMRRYSVHTQILWAASHERALFDVLHHFCEVKGQPVANIQVSDIDDVVAITTVVDWLDGCRAFMSDQGFKSAMRWLDG